MYGLPAGVATFGLVTWLIYGFPADPLQPFSQLSVGLAQLLEHNAGGHIAFFWGRISFTGHWLFFPTALLLKTPLPFLCLVAFGAFVILRHHRQDWRYWVPLASAAAMLSIAMLSRINLGVRYLLPLYPLAAMIAGLGAGRLVTVRSPARLGLLGLLLVGQLAAPALSWPDYLVYFNLLAGREPQRLLVDSDLDWGQDVNRVAPELRCRGIAQVATALHTNADLSRQGFPPYTELDGYEPTTGWIVISLTRLAFGSGPPPFDGYRWLERHAPVALIGKTVRLYYIDPATPVSGAEAK